MTNLSPDRSRWRQRFSRGRILIGAPIVLGVVVSLAVAGFDGLPRLERIGLQVERLEDLRRKQASLPGLLQQLKDAESRYQEVAQQQAVLLNLIAGSDKVQTFLAQISREALATGVAIERYEPVPPKPDETEAKKGESTKKGRSNNEKTADAEVNKDPVTELGYIKTSVLLEAQGGYLALQAFLQRMEALQLLVQPSDLALKAVDPPRGGNVQAPLTRVNLRLSFYDPAEASPAP